MKRTMVAAIVSVVVFSGISYSQEVKPPQMPEKVQAALERMVGIWSVEGDPGEDGTRLKGKTVVQWTPGKQYLIVNSEYQIGDISTYDTMIIGWDGLSKDGIILYRMAPVGQHSNLRLRVVSDTVLDGESAGVAEGKKSKAKGRFVHQGPDKVTYHETESTLGGESQPDWKVVYIRIKKN